MERFYAAAARLLGCLGIAILALAAFMAPEQMAFAALGDEGPYCADYCSKNPDQDYDSCVDACCDMMCAVYSAEPAKVVACRAACNVQGGRAAGCVLFCGCPFLAPCTCRAGLIAFPCATRCTCPTIAGRFCGFCT